MNSSENILLKNFWERTLTPSAENTKSHEWNKQLQLIFSAGKGLHETLEYLYSQRPSFEEFCQWVAKDDKIKIPKTVLPDVLTSDDLHFFDVHGYIVLHDAISLEECHQAKQAIISHLNIDLAKPESWYKVQQSLSGLMLMLYQEKSFEPLRNSPRVRKAYEQLYRTENIHPVIEKASFNPPVTDFYSFKGSSLHWDVSLQLPIPFKLQGLLYLNDVHEDGGAFQCVPGFHNQIDEWVNNLPADVDPREEALQKLKPVSITGKAGDFIIWHQALPHCATANHSKMPRFVQYHTYDPVDLVQQSVWK